MRLRRATKKKLDEVASFVRAARSFALLVVGNWQLLHFVTHFLLPPLTTQNPLLPSFLPLAAALTLPLQAHSRLKPFLIEFQAPETKTNQG